MATRRAVLAGLGALIVPQRSWADAGMPVMLAAGMTDAGPVLAGLSAGGRETFRLALPARGHAAAGHPTRPLAVAFARRPGQFALVIDCVTGAEVARLAPPNGSVFSGHGAFLDGGDLLATAEQLAETSSGRIGLWDVADGFRRMGDMDSSGIGPHEIAALPDGSLLVANGGIATDRQDRRKLNLSTMRPNLTRLSARGEVLSQDTLPANLHQLSIRHIAPCPGGAAIALQWEGDPAELPPVLALWSAAGLTLAPGGPEVWAAFQGYGGSVAATESGQIALSSAPGGAVALTGRDGHVVALHRRADLSGVASVPEGMRATDGSGAVWDLSAEGLTLLSRGGPQWDNHLIPLVTPAA
jgi:uncharacterized protein